MPPMGHATKKKQALAAQKRTRPELTALTGEALSFLRNSNSAFDNGFEAEAKRLAVTLHVLLHDTANSHSLLQQLGFKSSFVGWTPRFPSTPRNSCRLQG
jgi:hypothetical protein